MLAAQTGGSSLLMLAVSSVSASALGSASGASASDGSSGEGGSDAVIAVLQPPGSASLDLGPLTISVARLGSHSCCALITTSRGMLAVRLVTRLALSFAPLPILRSARTSDALPEISA